jgi:hypothetical protein
VTAGTSRNARPVRPSGSSNALIARPPWFPAWKNSLRRWQFGPGFEVSSSQLAVRAQTSISDLRTPISYLRSGSRCPISVHGFRQRESIRENPCHPWFSSISVNQRRLAVQKGRSTVEPMDQEPKWRGPAQQAGQCQKCALTPKLHVQRSKFNVRSSKFNVPSSQRPTAEVHHPSSDLGASMVSWHIRFIA